MAIGTTDNRPAGAPEVVRYEQYIDAQLQKARSQVKLVDLAGVLMTLGAGVLGFLLVLVVLDHWIVGLGFWARFLALATLLATAVYYVVVRLVPLVVRRINPLYAARVIERGRPSFKNSLLNLLLLQSERRKVHAGVYRAIEAQAANELTQVSVESTVDRSRLVKVGYVLAALVLVGSIYKIASPKDPFQTVARVAMPWRDIARPSRVRIDDVRPGDANVYHGRNVEVSARVRGVDADEPVMLYFSTADGQAADRPVAMRLDENGLRHQCVLPPDGEGLAQAISYRIEAGDADSREFRIDVRPAPSVVVASVQYNYPDYTGRANETVAREGHVEAIEGTRVTIHAAANQPIEEAFIELRSREPDEEEDGRSDNRPAASAKRNTVRMKVDGETARGSFTLLLGPDRQTSIHSIYRLRIETVDSGRNREPIDYQITVTRDLAPVVEILSPARPEFDVPEDSRQTIEVRALDPDFQLSAMTLRGVAGGSDLLTAELIDAPQAGQTIRKFSFVPRRLELHEGDVVALWAVAADNRTSALTGLPEPNIGRTSNYRIRITAPEQGDRAEDAEPEDDPTGPTQDQPRPDEADSDDAESDQPQPGDDGAAGDESTQQNGAAEEGAEQQDGAADEPSEQRQDGSAGEGSPQEGSAGDGEPQAADGDGSSDGEQSQDAAEQEGTDAGEGGRPSDDPAGEASDEPIANDGTQDGDVFEQVRKHMAKTGDGTATDEPTDGEPTDGEPTDGEPEDGASDDPSQRKEGESSDDAAGTSPEDGEQTEDGRPGDERKTEPGDEETPQGDRPGEPKPGQGDNGPGGAGRERENDTGTPDAQGENRQHPKDGHERSEEASENDEPESPSISERQSDSDNGEAGDRSGGGESGGGQSAKREGNDSAGSSSPGDEGAGAADEPGGGETGTEQGDATPGDRSDDGQGERAEDGSASTGDRQDGAGGQDDPAGDEREPTPQADRDRQQDSGSEASDSDRSGDSDGTSNREGATDSPQGGGVPGQGTVGLPEAEGGEPGADAANEKYAKEATDLVLDYLKDQQNAPDEALLDKLGWTKEDLQQFVDRWQQLNRNARQGGDDGQRELSDALGGLGLAPGAESVRNRQPGQDRLDNLRNAGGRTSPPAEYIKQYRAFLKSTGRQNDE